LLRGAGWLLVAVVVLLLGAWATLAIRWSNLPAPLRVPAAAAFALASLAAFLFLKRRRRTLAGFLVAWTGILVWWLCIPASNERDWRPELAQVTRAQITGDRVTLRGLRDCDYRTESDFDARWIDRSYDLRDLEGVDFVVSNWGVPDVSHTMLSFGFAGGEQVVLSIETRRERGESQGAIEALFKQYELIYVLGTERDLLRLRTGIREPHEQVWVFPTTLDRDWSRRLFVEVVTRADELAAHPRWYNFLAENCTTGILPLLNATGRKRRFDARLLLNGRVDELAWERGFIRNDVPLAELRRIHLANQYVGPTTAPDDYSRAIRPWKPAPGAPAGR
jgi:hypothetical protein